MILALNIFLAVFVVVGIVGLLAHAIRPPRRPIRIDEAPTGAPAPRPVRPSAPASRAGRRDTRPATRRRAHA